MMKHPFLFIFLLITGTSISQTTLQYNFNVGDNFTVQQEAKQHITQDINGVEQVIDNDLIGVMYFEVVTATPEHYTLSMSFKRLKMLMSSPTLGELSNADTESTDSSDVTNMLFKGILNVPVTILMEKTGKIKSVTGGEKLINAMFESAGIDQPELIEDSKAQMEKQFGSAALSNSIEQMTNFYPMDPVAVGTEWTNSYSGNMSAKNNWKLESLTNEAIIISGVADTTMSTIDENIVMTLTGSQKTTVTTNPTTGLFIQITVEGENIGDALVQAQNMTIPTTIKSKITYKITQ